MSIPSGPGAMLAELKANILERLGDEADGLMLERAVLGLFFSGVKLSNGVGGMSATLYKTVTEAAKCCAAEQTLKPGQFSGRPVIEVLEDLTQPQGLRRTIANATLNALAETLLQRDGLPEDVRLLEGDAYAALEMMPRDKVVLVGGFPSFLRELHESGQPFHVLELNPSVLKPEYLPYYVPGDQAADVVPDAKVVIMTGTTLLNDTIDSLLAFCRPDAEVAVIGPTATLSIGPYVRRGVTLLGGSRVKDADLLLKLVSEGAAGSYLFETTTQRVTWRLPKTK